MKQEAPSGTSECQPSEKKPAFRRLFYIERREETDRKAYARGLSCRAMIKKWNHNSIYFRLVLLLVVALICSGTFFALSDRVLGLFFDQTVRDSFQESENERHYQEFQKYVTDNRLSSKDTNALTRWVRQHRDLEMEIYKNYALIYDSMDPGFSGRPDQDDFYYTWQSNYVMTFKDGRAQLVLYGFYVHRMEIMLILLRVTVTFVIFLLIFLLGIRTEIRYIAQLGREVAILEGGDLTYPITVKGKDELSFLASSIESMRLGIQEEIRKNRETTDAFREVITEMSHDLRTPLTSLLLYTEILEGEKYEDPGQWKRYVRAIHEKGVQIKDLSDNIFEYSLNRSERGGLPGEIVSFRDLFYDAVSETAEYLGSQGFPVSLKGEFPEGRVRARQDYVIRILDNIVSNVLKYAAPGEEVVFQAGKEGDGLYISVSNRRGNHTGGRESTGIGLASVRGMMEKMGGSCSTGFAGGVFTIRLLFRTIS